MSAKSIIDENLEESLRSGYTDDILVLSGTKKHQKNEEQKRKKTQLEEAIEKYKPRPENAVPSRKKDQRLAEEVKQHLREEKRVRKLQEKQQEEITKRQKRLEIFERLKKTQLSREDRDSLKTSAELTKQITTVERQAGKVGERQRRKETRKRSISDVSTGSSRVVVIKQGNASSSEEEEENEPTEEDNVDIEEYGLVIPPTPTPQLVLERPSMQAATTSLPNSKQLSVSETALTDNPTTTALRKNSLSISLTTSSPVSVVAEPLLVVRPDRPSAMVEARSKLPVCAMEQEIVDAIKTSSVVFICGETGSGKTTQIPQMLLEAGFGCEASKLHPGGICVAQPRRVAAISVAERVGQELGCPLIHNISKNPSRGNRQGLFSQDLRGCVGYQIRHESDTISSDCTRIKFCTDGILLRECKEDFLLRQYSCIVMDEVHERGLNTDLLLGMLSRIVPLRTQLYNEGKPGVTPLRLVIMSATMDLEDFARLGFASGFPVIRIDTRQHPVVPHFSRRTEQVEYLQATFRKCSQVHEKLPPGGVLVFLPGQREIEWFCRQLKNKYNTNEDSYRNPLPLREKVDVEDERNQPQENDFELVALGSDGDDDTSEDDEDDTPLTIEPALPMSSPLNTDEITIGTNFSDLSDDEGDEADDSEDIRHRKTKRPKKKSGNKSHQTSGAGETIGRVYVVPLYSRLSASKQKMAFSTPPEGERMIVVATNVAETSLTIPGIRYVIDCGREKRRLYDQRTGTSGFRVDWISQASASQRMGRAGRVGPGHCYRLYSSAVYNDLFAPKTLPEILTVPIDDLILYMKTLGIDRIQEFPFPTPLDPNAIATSIIRLKHLACLEPANDRATSLGHLCSKLPIPVRVAKSLVVALEEPRFNKLLNHVVALCALLSLPSPFENQNITASVFRGDGTSDALALLRAAGAFSHDPTEKFCSKHGLNYKTMKEFVQLYEQLTRIVQRQKPSSAAPLPSKLQPMRPFGPEAESLLRQAAVSGLLDRIARKMEPSRARAYAKASGFPYPPRQARDWPYDACDPALQQNANGAGALFLHSHSVLVPPQSNNEETGVDPTKLPEFIAFTSLNESGRMEGCTVVEASWLRALSHGTSQCTDTVSETPEPFYDSKADVVYLHVKPIYGSRAWVLPMEKVPARQAYQTHLKAAVPAFARALMEGKVCGKITEEQKCLAPFAHLTRAPLQARVVQFVNRLQKVEIITRAQLFKKWNEDPTFLKREITEWLKPEERNTFEEQWLLLIKRITQSRIG